MNWFGLAVIVGVLLVALLLVDRREKRRALRHMSGREPRSASSFAAHFFQGGEVLVAERLVDVLARHLAVDLSQLHPDDRLVQDLRMDALDSLSTVEFVLDIEEELGVKIPNEVGVKMLTLRDVVTFVAAQQAAPPERPEKRIAR